MKKGYLFTALVHLIVFPLTCAYQRNNPIDEGGSKFVPPQISINEEASSVKDQDTIHFDSVTVELEGNMDRSIFRMKLDTGEWTIDWRPEGSFGVGGLSEGNHVLVINSMYDGGEMVVADTISFHVQTKGFRPEFTNKTDTTIESFGGKKIILVSAAEGKSPLQYTWLKGNTVLDGKSKDTLVFNSFSKSDTGSYKCSTTNEYGSDTGRTFILKFRPSTGGIKGIVTDTAEKIQKGTVVRLLPSNDKQVTTGSDGKFEFSGLTGNTYMLKFTLKGYVEKTVDDIKVNDSDVVDIKGIELEWIDTTTYKVTYSGNGSEGGDVPVDTTKYAPGSKIAVSGIENLTKTGHTFSKWNTKKEGTGDTVSPGDTITVNSNVTFYAQWKINQYTVSFKTEDKTSGDAPEPVKYNYQQTVTVPEKGSLERAGYTFKGWKTGDKVYQANDTFSMPASDVELAAQWEAMPTYAVKYDKNSADTGTVPIDSSSYYKGKEVTVAGNPGNLYRDGYSFAGWNTKPDRNGDTYNAGSKLSMPDTAITLYAKWSTNPTYSVIYHTEGSSGGTAPATATADSGAQVTIADSGSLYKTGYTFVEWNTQEDGNGKVYKTGDKITLGAVDIELYAQWKKSQYTVTYHGNGNNEGTAPPVTKYYHGTEIEIETSGTLQKTGHTFFKWNTDSLGNGVDYSQGAKITINKNMDFFARWKANEYTIVFNTHGGSTPSNQTVKYGDTVKTPAAPMKTGYVFDSWYKDSTCTSKWIFSNDRINGNDTLHSKWIIKDVDGNVYTEVKIGDQVWMVENLKTSMFNDSNPITYITDPNEWEYSTAGAYCYYDNDSTYKNKYGGLYDWQAVNTGKLAPSGWHVPTKDEIQVLLDYCIANGYNYNGSPTDNLFARSLAINSIDWDVSGIAGSPGYDMTSDNMRTGLKIPPSGYRSGGESFVKGEYRSIGARGMLWSATEYQGSSVSQKTNAWYLDLISDKVSADTLLNFKKAGRSVRCIRNSN